MQALYIILSAVIRYLLCSINVSVLISKFAYKSDVRDHGSGNAGATNMARVFGAKGGVLVLLGDFAKTIIAFGIVALLFRGEYKEVCFVSCGIAGVIGHAYPIFFNFKGGKGVTVGAAIALMIDWKVLLFIVTVFIVVFLITHIVSISSICGALGIIFITMLFYVFSACGIGGDYFDNFTMERLFLSLVAGLMVVWLHKENIIRLMKGEEKKFAFKKK